MNDWIKATCLALVLFVVLLALIAGGVALLDGLF